MDKTRDTITIEQLQDMGVRCKSLRWHLWFKHFVEVGPLDVAEYFLGKCYPGHGDHPEPWSDMRRELDVAAVRREQLEAQQVR